jgi:hypothetical protein
MRNAGRISRNTLTPIWEWICRDLLPTMARDYIKAINDQDAANNPREVLKIAATFQTKVVKVLENTCASAESTEFAPRQARAIHGVANRLRRRDEDAACAARRRRAAEVRREAARDDREIRRRLRSPDHRAARRLQEVQSQALPFALAWSRGA